MSRVPAIRERRRRSGWGVQEKRGWFWRWIGPFGDRSVRWPNSADALWFANLCERVDRRSAKGPDHAAG